MDKNNGAIYDARKLGKPKMIILGAQQGRGTGSALIADCKQALRAEQFKTLRLAIDEGNPQSKAFWQKNGFALTGQRTPNENGAYLPMECEL